MSRRSSRTPQADLLVTPPFIQKADESGLLVASGADTAGIAEGQVGSGRRYIPIVDNALSFIANPSAQPARLAGTTLRPAVQGQAAVLDPGQAGDGTAVLVLRSTCGARTVRWNT